MTVLMPPFEGLTIKYNLGFLDSDIEEFIELQGGGAGSNTQLNVVDNFELGNAPETTAQVGATYDLDTGEGSMSIGVHIAYRSDM